MREAVGGSEEDGQSGEEQPHGSGEENAEGNSAMGVEGEEQWREAEDHESESPDIEGEE